MSNGILLNTVSAYLIFDVLLHLQNRTERRGKIWLKRHEFSAEKEGVLSFLKSLSTFVGRITFCASNLLPNLPL